MEITKYTPGNGNGALKAFFSIRIPEWRMTINNCKLITTKDGGSFVSLPSYSYEKEGEKKYSPHIWLDKDVMEKFQSSAKKCLDEYLTIHPESINVKSKSEPDDYPF